MQSPIVSSGLQALNGDTSVAPQRANFFQNAAGFEIVGGQFVLGDLHMHKHVVLLPPGGSRRANVDWARDARRRVASRRSLSQPSDEAEDELTEEPLAANATDQEKFEYKRRQNTLAARRSRKRKLMHQQQLEEAVERLNMEKEVWKKRALTLSNLL
ncbi:hypothetical protein C8J57DRAFT_1120330, partial [Mycena rebaudengoi]